MIRPVGAGGGEEFAGKLPEQKLAAAQQLVTQYLKDNHIDDTIHNAVQAALEKPTASKAIIKDAQNQVDNLIGQSRTALPEGHENDVIFDQIKEPLSKEFNVEDAYKKAAQEKARAQLPSPFEAAIPKRKGLG